MSRFHHNTIGYVLPVSDKSGVIFHWRMLTPQSFQEISKTNQPWPIIRSPAFHRRGGGIWCPSGLIGLRGRGSRQNAHGGGRRLRSFMGVCDSSKTDFLIFVGIICSPEHYMTPSRQFLFDARQ